MPETHIVPAQGIKNEARRLVEQLSDEATWEDLMTKFTSGRRSKPDWRTVVQVESCP